MMRWLYSCALWLAQPLLRRKLRRRALAEPGYGEAVPERFGHYSVPAEPVPTASVGGGLGQRWVWVHAVSLGETRAAAVLVAQLRAQWPGMRLLLPHGTATGRAQGRSLLRPGDVQVWQPWDTPGAVARFLAHFRPCLGVLLETEIWPNLVAGCARAGVPLCLVNARLSEKSLRAAQRLAWLSGPAYRGLTAVWAQSEADAARLTRLGAPVRGVLGNFKFDASPDAAQLARGHAWRQACAKPVLMLASSREGEEQALLEFLKQNQPLAHVESKGVAIKNVASADVQWLLVPRHPQRFDAVAQLCVAHGWAVSRRSTWADGPPAQAGERVLWLGDSLGEMALYFGLADVALLGGSFAPLGGQNLIEAAACGCPVVMGPHTFNFSEASALARTAGAAFAAADLPDAVQQAQALLHAPQALAKARTAALALGQAHRGAARRTATALQAVLDGVSRS